MHLQIHSILVSKLARSWPPSVSPNSLGHGFRLHLGTRMIAASKCISELAQSQPPSASPLFKGIPPLNEQWQPHYNFLSHQFAKHCRCNRGESLSKTHFIRHQCSWHITIPNPSPHDERDGSDLARRKLCSGQAWNGILAAWNTVIC